MFTCTLIVYALFTIVFSADYPCTFEVLSIDHNHGTVGQYFNFEINVVDGILGRTNWANTNFNIYNQRTQQVKNVVIWRNENGGSVGDGHGREDDGTSASGDFQTGDVLSFIGVALNCQPSPCTFGVLSIDHNHGTIGQYFNFDNNLVDNILDRIDDWSNENFNVYNSRTKQIKKVILWKSSNGGSIGDGHGREDDGTSAAGDFAIGDKISFVGRPTFCEPSTCSFPVLSIDHNHGTVGQYFNFEINVVDDILDRSGDWSHENFVVYNSRSGYVKRVVLWSSSNGGSIGDGHGREDDMTSVSGDFQVNDEITILNNPNSCNPLKLGVTCSNDANCPCCMQCCPKRFVCEYPPTKSASYAISEMNEQMHGVSGTKEVFYDPIYVCILLVGVALFVLVNNVFIGYWCVCKKDNSNKDNSYGKCDVTIDESSN